MQAVPGEFLSIDRKERVNQPFSDLTLRSPNERVCDFDDVVMPFDEERAKRDASRCIHCPDPAPCMVACPTHNDIPSAMWLIEQGKFKEAAQIYHQTSSLPDICGRVCPHEQLCQGSCVLNKTHTPVLTGQLEVFAMDWKYATAEELTVAAFYPHPNQIGSVYAQIVASGPDEEEDAFHGLMFAAINTAQYRISLATSYFVPPPSLVSALESAAQRGVKTRVLISGPKT